MNTQPDQLLPCPFCGETDLAGTSNGLNSSFIECNHCGASGPVYDENDSDVAAWNNRTPPPTQGVRVMDAWKKAAPEIIRAVAAIVNMPQTDSEMQAKVLPRAPVMEQAVRIRNATGDISAAARAASEQAGEGGPIPHGKSLPFDHKTSPPGVKPDTHGKTASSAPETKRAGTDARAACATCSGRGEVGGHVGQTPEQFEYVTELCPDCSAPDAAQGAVAVVDDLLDVAFRELQHDTGPQDPEYRHQRKSMRAEFRKILKRRPAADAAVVPEGWRVMHFTGSFRTRGERWEIYDPDGNGGTVSEGSVEDETVARLLDAMAAAPQPEAGGNGGACIWPDCGHDTNQSNSDPRCNGIDCQMQGKDGAK